MTSECLTNWAPPHGIQELAAEQEGLIQELIESYTTDMERRLQRIRAAMRSSDARVLRSEVHTIKGSSRQMAAHHVAAICEQIEAAGRERPMANLADLIGQLESRIAEACAAMDGYQRAGQERLAS